MRILIVSLLTSSIPVFTFAQFKPTPLPFQPHDQLNNPACVISRKDVSNMVVTCGSGEILTTTDGGVTWKAARITSAPDIGNDPVIVSDRKGNFYSFRLSPKKEKGNEIICHVSKDMGASWEQQGSFGAEGKSYSSPRIGVHPRSGDILLASTQFSSEPEPQSMVIISNSKDGKKWSTPLKVSPAGGAADDDSTPRGAWPAISTNGLIFLAWSQNEHIYLDRSFDKGDMWLSNDIHIQDQTGGWSFDVPGLSRCSGVPSFWVDTSPGRFNGALFLVWADQRNGTDDTDIWFSRSVNHGDNWTPAVKINDDGTGKHQFMPVMTIDQATGHLYVLFYDRRNYDDAQTDVYMAYSFDNGTSFKNIKINTDPIQCNGGSLGSSIGIDAYRGMIVPVWTTVDDQGTSVHTVVIKQEEIEKALSETK